MYSGNLLESIELVEKTRESREKQQLPLLCDEEKSQLLSSFHPDYRLSGFRTLRVGVNKGDRTVHEIADLLEAFSSFDYREVNLESPDIETDVLVLGGGGAGITAALFAHSAGAKVILATKLRLGNSNTIMALGGMQASVSEDDSPIRHFADTMVAGKFQGRRELVKAMVDDGPLIVKWLLELGVNFDRDEKGNLLTKRAGGSTAPRILSIGDYTGLNIIKILKDEIRNRPDIEILEFAPAVELTTNEFGECNGAILFDLERKRFVLVKAKSVILATGGSGRLHIQGFQTSNNFGATGDAIVLAYRAGAKLEGLDSFQYHPTGIVYPDHMVGVLVTEAIRSLGAHLVNAKGERFINELETRDVVAAAMIKECEEGRGVETPSGRIGVWLDTPVIEEKHGKGFLKKKFPALFRMFMRVKINIEKQLLLVYPTLHYQNGGILIDEKGETTVKNLFVAGEAAGGIHGKNRLMGNSLLDIFVFGRRAGLAAARRKYSEPGRQTLSHLERYYQELKSLRITTVAKTPRIFQEYIVGD
ncbi:FAD-binding protein [Desulfurobacterium sp.]|uniref:FAD-binding protein n=1 Tax=Desulfurobacterium sp. TaxID=2004706 RepID=UPI00261C84E7|nr:FAD-binding protein [Desulfurobacterium sp.]